MALNLSIKYQEKYSRAQLLVRTIPGLFYIYLPHLTLLLLTKVLCFANIVACFLSILVFQKIPNKIFNFNLEMHAWQARVLASMMHLYEGYPQFPFTKKNKKMTVEVLQKEKYSRFHLLIKLTFGLLYLTIPHGVILLIRISITVILTILAWFSVLIQGKYPKSWFEFNLGTLRWSMRYNLYQTGFIEMFPKFGATP